VAMGRAPCCDKANVKRGPWSPEEDATLKAYVESHGTGGNWIALPKKAGFSLFSPNTIFTFFSNTFLFILFAPCFFSPIQEQIKLFSRSFLIIHSLCFVSTWSFVL